MQRPTNLSTNTECTRQYNVDQINLSPSPIDSNYQQRYFKPGMLFDSQTFQRIQAQVFNDQPFNLPMLQQSDDDDNEDDYDIITSSTVNLFDDKTLEHRRQEEIQQLSQSILYDRPTNDSMVEILMQQLNNTIEETALITDNSNQQQQQQQQQQRTTSVTTTNLYPPLNQLGLVADHDRPYADYGHLDRNTIAQEFQFDLQPSTLQQQQSQQNRLHAKSFAITAWTNVPKETVMNEIKRDFGIDKIQYICIGEEISELNHRRHLHIQIILKDKVNRRKPFLDEITQTHCNYQVTRNDRAWNEYIRKGDDFIEFGNFHSVSTRGQKQWSSSSSFSSSASSSTTAAAAAAVALPNPQQLPTTTTTIGRTTTTTVRAQAEQRRQYEIQIAKQALTLAKTSINQAMDLMENAMPTKFITHSSWYLTTFNYVHLRAQQEKDRQGNIDKEYIWPHSFPNCTPELREAINQWIQHHFFRAKRAKCLVLIGPTGVGKTSFALSLPGRINYFSGRWNLDQWNDYARYSVYDDIPWDEFKNLNYPNKKDLLTQNGKTNATDKYRSTRQINIQQPAIILLNPEDAGSLLQQPVTDEQQNIAAYWRKRAFIYVMGPNEYFHKHRQITRSSSAAAAAAATSPNDNTSSNSSMDSNTERMGNSDEFERMYRQFNEKHSK